MNLTKYHPSHWFSHEDGDRAPSVRRHGENPRETIHSELDRMFDDFFTTMGYGSQSSPLGKYGGGDVLLKPDLDLAASDKEYSVTVELPGVSEEDITVEVNRDMLTISGEKKREFEEKSEKGVYRAERSYGAFHRTLALPEDIDVDGIRAAFDKGVLRVTIPRTKARETKRIAIANE